MNLTPQEFAEIEYEQAEEKYDEQKYICNSLRMAIETIQNLDWSEARDETEYELESELRGANHELRRREIALSVADTNLKRFGG